MASSNGQDAENVQNDESSIEERNPEEHTSDTISDAIQSARSIWISETGDALSSAEQSQIALEKQLDALDRDMKQAATALTTTATIGGIASHTIHQTQECLIRARRKLTTVRARVGRLRALEEAQRLSFVQDDNKRSTLSPQ